MGLYFDEIPDCRFYTQESGVTFKATNKYIIAKIAPNTTKVSMNSIKKEPIWPKKPLFGVSE